MLDMSLDKFLDYVYIKDKNGNITPIKQNLTKTQLNLLLNLEKTRIKKNKIINLKTN